MTNLILAALAALVIGIVIGILVGRSGQGQTLRQRRAEQQIEELRSEYTRYQAQVNEHFMEAAHLLRRFNDAYRDVNQHMARGANRLCNDEDWLEELEHETSSKRLEDVRGWRSGGAATGLRAETRSGSQGHPGGGFRAGQRPRHQQSLTSRAVVR